MSAGALTRDLPDLRRAVSRALHEARRRPSFGLYLGALLLFPFKWLSPFSHEQAGWIDVLIAASAAVWAWEALRARRRPRLRAVHWIGLAFLALTTLSAAFAADRSLGVENLLIAMELAVLAVLTSDFARVPERRSAIVVAVLAVTFVTAAQAVVALGLFYAGVRTSMLGTYGSHFTPSDLWARISAGFFSAPLLGSFCIFASAVLAREDSDVPRRWRQVGQVLLACLVVLTVSRALIGFALAFAIRAGCRREPRHAGRVVAGAIAIALLAILALTVVKVSVDVDRGLSTRATLARVDDNQRVAGTKTSFDTLEGHPLVGSGPGSVPGEFQRRPSRAHLTPLNVAATTGVPAALALVALVVALWRQRRRPTDVATWSGIAGLAVDAIANDVEHYRHVWILLGLADADRRHK